MGKEYGQPSRKKLDTHSIEILGIHFLYDNKGNDEVNCHEKLKVLQTKLDRWSS